MSILDIDIYNKTTDFQDGVVINSNNIIKHDPAKKTWIELSKVENTIDIFQEELSPIHLMLSKLTCYGYEHKVNDICISSSGSKIAFLVNDYDEYLVGVYVLSQHETKKDLWVEEQFIKIETADPYKAFHICFLNDNILVSAGILYDNTVLIFNSKDSEGYKLNGVLTQDELHEVDLSQQLLFSIEAISSYRNNLQLVFSLQNQKEKIVRYYYSEIILENEKPVIRSEAFVEFPSNEKRLLVQIEDNKRIRFQKIKDAELTSFENSLKNLILNTTVYSIGLDQSQDEITLGNADTDKIKEPEEKEKMLRRHHLIIQQLLNNVAISIKENRPVDFEMKSLEITEDRVKITGLKYKTLIKE